MQKIAIIGGGAAGVVAAWLLSKKYKVILFEKDKYLGGHAYSQECNINNNLINVDMGVEFFSEKSSPNLMELLKLFNLETFVTPLSFSGEFEGKYFWSNSLRRCNIYENFYNECDRFHKQLNELFYNQNQSIKFLTIQEFLNTNGYSKNFAIKILYPLLTVFSSCRSPLADFSMSFCLFLFATGLLSLHHPTYWRKLKGGINQYFKKIIDDTSQNCIFKTEAEVLKVFRTKNKCNVILKNNEKHIFEKVIFATHADIALKILDNPTRKEKEILSKFNYTQVSAILHCDELMKINNSYDYLQFKNPYKTSQFKGYLTRVLNNIPQYAHIKKPLLVSYDCEELVDKDKIINKKIWSIPNLDKSNIVNTLSINKIQGYLNTWYCGTDTSFSGHEGAILSSFILCEKFGIPYPFKNHNWARTQYYTVKNLMGFNSLPEKFMNHCTDKVIRLVKKFNFHPFLSSKIISSLYG